MKTKLLRRIRKHIRVIQDDDGYEVLERRVMGRGRETWTHISYHPSIAGAVNMTHRLIKGRLMEEENYKKKSCLWP